MTIPSSRYEPADPTVRSPGGAGAPIRPVLPERRGLRQQAGIVAVAVVAIAVVAAGIGLGRQENEPLPEPSGTPPSASAAATAASAGPSGPATPAPTELPGLGCLPAAPAQPPLFRLSSSPAFGDPVGGVAVPASLARSAPPTSAWPVPPESMALVLDPSAPLLVEPDDPVCVRYAVAEYIGVGNLGEAPTWLGLGATNVNPPRPSVALGTLPAGDWVVRVVAYFSTGVVGDEDQVVVERFFRVITGLAPDATPIVTPAVPCAPLPADAPLPGLTLTIGNGQPVPGADPTADPAPGNDAGLAATYRDRLVIGVAGDACATSWRVRFSASGGFTQVVVNEVLQENPGDNPFLVSQNRIELTSANLGRTIVSAAVSFGRSRQTTARWDLTVTAPAPPAAEVIGPAGSRVPALAGCGVGVTLTDGRSAWEHCENSTVPDGLEVLRVKAGQAVRLDLPGLPIVSWWVSCGERSPTGAYIDAGGCQLGGAGDGVREVGPARFLPFPGRHIVAAWISVRRGDETIGAQYFAEIEVEP